MARRPAEPTEPAEAAAPASPPSSPSRARAAAPERASETEPVPPLSSPPDEDEPVSAPPASAPAARKGPPPAPEAADPDAAVEAPRAPTIPSDATDRAEREPPSLREKRIGVIGAGAMGRALCEGLVLAGAAPANRILVSDAKAGRVQSLHASLGIRVAESNSQVAKYTDVILLAVPGPEVLPLLAEVAEALRREAGKPLPLIISLASGVPLSALESHLSEPLAVVRAVANLPLQVAAGASAYARGTNADAPQMALAARIFTSLGIAVEVPESLLDTVLALSGAGPAYAFLILEAMIDGGVQAGLPRETARQLAAQTLLGSARMVLETGQHPAQLRDLVAEPASPAATALAALERDGLRPALIDAIALATAHSRELERPDKA
ncbi:MAG TPA: pyrroline-5-carboxylate reductase [Chthonomonadaceae bacterium]|nr:pyrroline-5-carboxylate reductase [Chthonomonadaceae bacterium]